MSEEKNINENDTQEKEQESSEDISQEDLAAQWEEQMSESTEEEGVDQEALAAQWEQEAVTESNEEVSQEDLAAQWEKEALGQEAAPSYEGYEKSENSRLSLLMDIPLEVTVEIGSTKMPIEEVLKLNPNSVIELDKFISEPVDLKVNGKLIAKGELYTVKNSFGIKITNVITPEERMKLLDRE
ncbi:flagellar motor switch protein FliN [Nitrosophilus alvini]|uniref:flagellar motor switch protein FliN n=1 Tax=Nitrosophilus alvini TaxID=2714855 RepID=UPI001F1A8EAB|nr:flagellar motor switch protein FliN [Nitrosophilus alvini]